MNIIVEHHKNRKKWVNKFRETFGVSLDEYWTPIFGFDTIKFDNVYLIPKHNYEDGETSMADCVRKEYGEEAVEMIMDLI